MPLGDSVTIREAVLSDAPAVATVHVLSWQAAYRGLIPDSVLDGLSVETRTSLWEHHIPSGRVWVAFFGSELVGFATAGPSRDADATSELYAIYLLPSAWGTGLALPLATAALDGLSDVVVWVLEGNERARRFYERLGFRADGMTRQETMGTAVLNEFRLRTA